MESLIIVLGLVSAIMTIAGAVWIAVIAFQHGETGWGIGALICGIVTLVYGFQNFEECKIPLALFGFGILIRIGGIAMAGGV